MPGFNGDEPGLVHFRAALENRFRFIVARYPSWREMCRTGAGFTELVDYVVAQVVTTFGDNDCLLAGYSFGGFVACEAARRLVGKGHRVTFVGLIDARREDPAKAEENTGPLRLLYIKPRRLFVQLLISKSAFRLLYNLGNLALLLPARAAFWFHSRLIAHLRLFALRKAEIKSLNIPITLFLSDEDAPDSTDRWSAACEKLCAIHIGGTHLSILEPPYRTLLCERFLEATEAARHGFYEASALKA
jgi:thioesterase domain-containing protein